MHPDYSTDQVSSLVYDGEAHAGIYEAVSMPSQVTGRCCGCRRLLELQISSQICQGTPGIAVLFHEVLS